MYTRIVALALGLGVSSMTLKADNSSHHNFAGFNFGGQFGMGVGNTKVTRQYLVAPTNSDNSDVATNGVMGGINLGYGWLLPQNYFIGLNGQYDYAEITGTVENNSDNLDANQLKLKLQYMYSGYIRLGKILHNVLPYLKAGITYGRWQSHITSVAKSIDGSSSTKISKTITGWTVGLGSDFLITKNLSIGADYSYTRFNNFDFQYPGIIDYKTRPKLHTIILNVRWYL